MISHRFHSCAKRVILLAVPAFLFLSNTPGYSFTALYSFGDSLTDTGNAGTSTNYYQRRWSNGPLWVEYLSAMLGIPYNTNNNRAYAGTTSSDLMRQVTTLPAFTNSASSLFTVWSGQNDFILGITSATNNDAAWDAIISNAVMNITNAVAVLYTNGAREVLVPNLIPMLDLPIVRIPAIMGGYTAYGVSKVTQFNNELGTAVTNLAQANPGLRIYVMNDNQYWDTIYNSAATYGFTVTSNGVLQDTNLTDKSFNGPGANYLYWDSAGHPTTKMHALLGKLAFSLVGVQLQFAGNATNLSLTVSNLYPGLPYSILGSTNLVTWTNYETFTATNTNLTVSMANSRSGKAFYRVKY